MLEDRSYMHETSEHPWRSATTLLLGVLLVVFVLQSVVRFYEFRQANGFINQYLCLSLPGLKRGFLWQLLTFQFLHGGVLHLLLNGLTIFFLGRELERNLGPRRYLALYFLSGVAGGLLQMLFAGLFPRYFSGPVVGASAGAYGLLAAFAGLSPQWRLTLLVFFVLPVTLTARTIFIISAAIAIYGIVIPDFRIAHAAHLGGMVFGFLFARHVLRDGAWNIRWPAFHWRARRRPELVSVGSTKSPAKRPSKASGLEVVPNEEFISREVDPILDKISAHGIQSLTERERRVLEAARSRIGKR